MRIDVAVHAFRKFLVDRVAMGQTVTVLTLGNRRMLSFVAVNAVQLAVFGCGFAQLVGNIPVTGAAESNRGIFRGNDSERFMRIMTGQAIGGLLTFFMGLMAFRAVRDPAMHIMTEGTGLFGMLALVFGNPLKFLCMTGAAFGLGVLRKFKRSDGHVGVCMTTHTILELEMGSVRIIMAAGTFGNKVFAVGKMLDVTIKAGNFGLMLSPVGGNPLRLLIMAFYAIRHLQLGSFFLR